MLQNYQPSTQGQALINKLSSLDLDKQQESLLDYWKQNAHELAAVLDGFHHLTKQVLKLRSESQSQIVLALPDSFLFFVIKGMKEGKYYFSYPTGNDFFSQLNKTSPSIFENSSQASAVIKTFFPNRFKVNSKFNFPEDFDDSVLERCRQICEKAKQAYQEVLRVRPS
ncbi:MAG: hypothetical protein COB67_08280, partial [SAR324 cluster bacterium]